MSEKSYKQFMETFSNVLSNDFNLPDHNKYGPLTSEYWEQKNKIAIYNLEPYDPVDGIREINFDVFKVWFGSPTIRFAAVIANAIFSNINNNYYLQENEIRYNFDDEELLESAKKIAYLNFSVTDNEKGVAADYNRIYQEIKKTNPYLKQQIELLNPDVIIVGGNEGCKMLNIILQPNEPLNYRSMVEFDGKLLVSMNHLSGQGASGGWYKMIQENVTEITKYLKNRMK
jgi:hypothetical protein